MTALEILKQARVLVGDEWEWRKWEAKRATEKAQTIGEDAGPMVLWALRRAGAGTIEEYGKALKAVVGVMGNVDKFSEQGWKANVAAMDRAILSEQAKGKK